MKIEIALPELTEDEANYVKKFKGWKLPNFVSSLVFDFGSFDYLTNFNSILLAFQIGYTIKEKRWNVIFWKSNHKDSVYNYTALKKGYDGCPTVFTRVSENSLVQKEYLFTASELEQVKKDYPQFASIIEAGKREVVDNPTD